MEDNRLFRLLSHSDWYAREAIIQEVNRSPQSAATIRHFTYGGYGYPLHQAIKNKAHIEVVEAIYNAYPPAIKKKFIEQTALHFALWVGSSPNIIQFLVSKWPKATRVRDRLHQTPLYIACKKGASVEVVRLLLNCCPNAIRKRNSHGQLPLHGACGASKTALEMILLLLEKYPKAACEKNKKGEEPLDIYCRTHSTSDVVMSVLTCVSTLSSSEALDMTVSSEIMSYFIEIKWYRGVALLLDHHPYIIYHDDLNIGNKVLPGVLSMLGRCCNLRTMWHVISNKQDILSECVSQVLML